MNPIRKHPTTHEQKESIDPLHQERKFATYTYIGKEIKRNTKPFKETPIKIAFTNETKYKI
jgi:hypothetical protein